MREAEMRGFTLIELMIVVAIIGILAGIAMPSYQTYTVRAQLAEALTLAAELKAQVRDFHKASGRFPPDNRAAGLPAAKYLIGNYVESIDVANGALHVRLGNRASRLIAGKVLTLQPLVVQDSPASPMSWSCGRAKPPKGMRAIGDNRTDVDDQFLPYACRDV
jgi:type IV pilus assembly protein PilA